MNAADQLNAVAFQDMLAGHYPEATHSLRRALEADPKNVHARNNLATCLKQLGREEEAIRQYEALIADRPDFLYAVNNLAFSYLRAGRYKEAWALYHQRRAAHIKIVEVTNPLTGKPFMGEPLPSLDEMRGRNILMVLEQGIGDELFFLRFVPHLMALAKPASVWYAPGLKLYPLLRRIKFPEGFHVTDSRFSGAPRDGFAMPIADLPLACGHDGGWFPASLRMSADRVSLKGVPIEFDRRGVGVAWRAGDRDLVHRGGTSKQLPPEALGAALRGRAPLAVVMQRNPHPDELAAFRAGFGGPVEVYKRHEQPALELEALCERLAELSGYVGVSNTDMHLLALMGRTAHTLVIHPAEWRWLGPQVDKSPWFPGFKRYHQDVFGWEAALQQLSADLAA